MAILFEAGAGRGAMVWGRCAALMSCAALSVARWVPLRRRSSGHPALGLPAALGALRQGALILDECGRIQEINGEMARILDIQPAESVGRHWEDMAPAWMPAVEAPVAKASALAGAVCRRPAPRPACFLVSAGPLRIGPGNACGTLITLQDITPELMHTEERERQQHARHLHDGIGQTLSACLMHLVRAQQGVTDAGTAERLATVQGLLEGGLQEVRLRMCEAAPPTLRERGLVAGLRWLASHLSSVTHATLEVETQAAMPPLPFATEFLLFSSARAALLDALAHSQVRHAGIRCESSEAEVAVVLALDDAGAERAGPGAVGAAGDPLCPMGAHDYVLWAGGSVQWLPGCSPGAALRIALPLAAESADER